MKVVTGGKVHEPFGMIWCNSKTNRKVEMKEDMFLIIDIDNFRISLLLKKYGYNNWLSIFIFSVISIICGLIIIVNPTTIGTIAITTYLGLILSIYAISNIIDSIFFIKNIKEITKLLKK